MTRAVAVLTALVLLVGACDSENEGVSEGNNSNGATVEAQANDDVRSVEDLAADLQAAGLCSDPTPGDPGAEALGSLVPTSVTRCTTDNGADVTIFVYPSPDDATGAAEVAFDFTCSFGGGDGFALLVAGTAVVQIDTTEPAEALSFIPADMDALAAAEATLGGEIRTPDC